MKLSPDEIKSALSELPGWELVEGKLVREFKFKDFQQAWGFMTRAALLSEKMDHHPDWSNCYNTVEIKLWSHYVGGITKRDMAWANAVSKIT